VDLAQVVRSQHPGLPSVQPAAAAMLQCCAGQRIQQRIERVGGRIRTGVGTGAGGSVRCRVLDGVAQGADEGDDGAAEHRVLAGVVPVERRGRNADFGGDLVHADPVVSALAEQGGGAGRDARLAVLRAQAARAADGTVSGRTAGAGCGSGHRRTPHACRGRIGWRIGGVSGGTVPACAECCHRTGKLTRILPRGGRRMVRWGRVAVPRRPDPTVRSAMPADSTPPTNSGAAALQVRRAGGVFTVTIDRPSRMNALDGATVDELIRTLADGAREEGTRVVVLSGAGRAFCTGADLADMAAAPPPADAAEADERAAETMRRAESLVRAVIEAPVPVLAHVTGPAAGLGASLAVACDLVYASREAYFLLSFTGIGLMPDGAASLLVPASIGRARANAMVLLGERLAAEDAESAGLVNEVVDADALEARV